MCFMQGGTHSPWHSTARSYFGHPSEGWAVVELKQFCFGHGNGCGVPHPVWRRAAVAGVSGRLMA